MNRPMSKGSLLPMLLAATSMMAPPFEEESYVNVNVSRKRDARVAELERERARKHERLQEIKRQRRKK